MMESGAVRYVDITDHQGKGRSMKQSTIVMLLSALSAQPILWMEHPMAELGSPVFFGLATVMCAGFLVSLAMWARESKED